MQATVAFTFLLIQSPSAVRHSFYEVFLHMHIIAAAIAVAGVWIHLNGRPQQLMMYGVVSLWVFEVSLNAFRSETLSNGAIANIPLRSHHHA